MRKYILVSLLLLLPSLSYAGRIRSISMNAKKMQVINLKMGQSTVIRFREKTKKVVIGNQNYYSVEFIENDVTIQPLSPFSTNLFVYGPHHVFGFILKPGSGSNYDDVVNVRWEAEGIIFQRREKPSPVKKVKMNLELKLKDLQVKVHQILINKQRGTHILDFTITNNGKKISSKDISVYLTRSYKKLDKQEMVFEFDELKPKQTMKGRVLVTLTLKRAFTFNVKFKEQKLGKIVSRSYL